MPAKWLKCWSRLYTTKALALLGFCVALAASACTSQIDPIQTEQKPRFKQLQSNPKVGETIIRGIKQYSLECSTQPQELNDLVPVYLSEVPLTSEEKPFDYSLSEANDYMLCFNVAEQPGCCYLAKFQIWDCTRSD